MSAIKEGRDRAKQNAFASAIQAARDGGLEMFLSIEQVEQITSRDRTQIYEGVKSGTFPPFVKNGPRKNCWLLSEISAWQRKCIEQSRGKPDLSQHAGAIASNSAWGGLTADGAR